MDLHTTTRSAATKPAPDFSSLSPAAPVFEYHPSLDGIDTNLLIFFHGLGNSLNSMVATVRTNTISH